MARIRSRRRLVSYVSRTAGLVAALAALVLLLSMFALPRVFAASSDVPLFYECQSQPLAWLGHGSVEFGIF